MDPVPSGFENIAVIGPGRIGRQIALAFAMGGHRVLLVDVKDRDATQARRVLAEARREVARDLDLMADEGLVPQGETSRILDRIQDRRGLPEDLGVCGFVQEALPEDLPLKRAFFGRLTGHCRSDAIVASTSSTISPSHMVEAVDRPERFLVAKAWREETPSPPPSP